MAKRNQHVVPHKDGWGVRGANTERITKITETKNEATKIAKTIAKNQGSELFIHRGDGKFQSRDSYGNDPFPPRG